MQYGLQQSTLRLTQSNKESYWKDRAIFCIFDAPEVQGVFEERIDFLKKLKNDQNWPSFLQLIDMVKCKNKNHLQEYFDTIISKNGEGIVLRAPESQYEQGRSNDMRKYKQYQDTEVRVIQNKYPHGLECEQYVIII